MVGVRTTSHPTMDIDYFWNNVYRFRQSRGRILRDPIKQLITITKSSNFKVRFSQSTANFSSWRWCCCQFSKQFDLCQSARSTACSLPTHGFDYVMDFETYHHRAKSRPPILYRNQVFLIGQSIYTFSFLNRHGGQVERLIGVECVWRFFFFISLSECFW